MPGTIFSDISTSYRDISATPGPSDDAFADAPATAGEDLYNLLAVIIGVCESLAGDLNQRPQHRELARVGMLAADRAAGLVAQGPGVDFGAFVKRYADDWMRFHTNAASSRRYFTGAEEDAIERQIEPVTGKQRNDELELIRRGLNELGRFDRARLAPTDQRSFDIIRWDLQTQQNGAAFDDDRLHRSPHERKVVDGTCRRHARQGAQALDRRVEEGRALRRLRVTRVRQRHPHRQDALRVEAGVDGPQRHQAAQHPRAPHQQDHAACCRILGDAQVAH